MSMFGATTGRVMLKMAETLAVAAPAHLDVIAGAARPGSTLDRGGPLDRCVRHCCSAMRVRRVFHARHGFGRPGERGTGFADDEQHLGLDRVYALELSEPQKALQLSLAFRDLAHVEWAMPERVATYAMASQAPVKHPTREMIEAPHKMVRADVAHRMEPGARNILVAAVDTGVALEHDEFSERLYGGYDTVDLGMGRIGDDIELVGDSRGRDFAPWDETGHGTHVAGVMSANGIHLSPGVAGLARLVPVRALAAAKGSDGRLVGVGGTLDIDAAIKAATELGAQVINMSFGTAESLLEPDSPPVHYDAVNYALNRGVIPVAAMGNSGTDERYYPAALDGVIAVAAVDQDGRRADYSTLGAHCAIAAPGTDIISVGLSGYRFSTGTSHAAPFVSGAVALMLARAARAGVRLDSATCRELLQNSAQPSQQERAAVGAGILDVAAALSRTDVFLNQTGKH